jgi:hypothetical protein
MVQLYNRNSFFSDQQSFDAIDANVCAQLEQLPLIGEELPHVIAFGINEVEQVPEPEEMAEHIGKKL